MKRDYKLFIKDIISAMKSIEEFVEGLSLDEVKEDDKTSSAVIRKFDIIGEATRHVPEDLKEKYPDIPWKRMAGMRDRLIHAYFGVDYRLVWEAIKIDLPKLRPRLEEVLAGLEKIDVGRKKG